MVNYIIDKIPLASIIRRRQLCSHVDAVIEYVQFQNRIQCMNIFVDSRRRKVSQPPKKTKVIITIPWKHILNKLCLNLSGNEIPYIH